ncbi:NADH dehydrogenase subunit E [Pseudooceanicola antarcticus]|uniref:NADH dehydrogenase subunit E n=1 Tax=Pseudooceanicola antarcticus TaxID=1247613 RepID=A0A285J5N6_9RHOB|nr:NADH-quinone oxidoreductase subunit E [Pseudooceanicola antarcticus]PJE29779.1 NADH-quinone oxidoreductase subunit NuoE [Pseudooceanicola antarcticus]SNY54411.1 NADH dehydrogenase subunit E [Pseudooceanicola antarcticus]
MLRRLHQDQPESFAFTEANLKWAEGQISKYPEGRQASAVIPLLWRAQEQEGWLSKPAIEYVAKMLDMADIRVLEVATFYFMFQLQPTGSVAHIQICGTTTCMICGSEDLISVCKDKINAKPHELSADGKFSWEEVECLGACANAPMAQIGKDYYEDLTAEKLAELLDKLAAGEVPVPGPQNGRFSSEPEAGLVALTEWESGRTQYNASVARAVEVGDGIKRIDGTEVPLLTPWRDQKPEGPAGKPKVEKEPKPAADKPVSKAGATKQEANATAKGKPASAEPAVAAADVEAAGEGAKPEALDAARDGKADDLKKISGVGPKLEGVLNEIGIFHFDQIAAWDAAQVAWADQNLVGFKGRVSRDDWVGQARKLAKGE